MHWKLRCMAKLNQIKNEESNRRQFFLQMAALSIAPIIVPNSVQVKKQMAYQTETLGGEKSIIGHYGQALMDLSSSNKRLWSFLHQSENHLESWSKDARTKVEELLCTPSTSFTPSVKVVQQFTYDGLYFEKLLWTMPYGRQTSAMFIRPVKYDKSLPGILALHDHGGNKYFGHRKIIDTGQNHELITEHQAHYYGGKAWANEIAKRGYAVLVHDVFTFGSRRVQYQDISHIPWGDCSVGDKTDDHPEKPENIYRYNEWAAAHEHIMAKSLFSAGFTWPGITLFEDRMALSILANRSEVDEHLLGCGGLSGGGLRTVYLAGLDTRIKCAVAVGFMSTWRDFALHKSYTHTWMTYTPILSKFLDFPEILSLRMPRATMVQNCKEDQLFTLTEMEKAVEILEENYAKAECADHFKGNFYTGPHQFNQLMQADAFQWFDQWLQ